MNSKINPLCSPESYHSCNQLPFKFSNKKSGKVSVRKSNRPLVVVKRASVRKPRPSKKKSKKKSLKHHVSKAGGLIGSKLGSWAGGAAERLLTTVTGMGDYTAQDRGPIRSNSILGVQTPESRQIPVMHKDKGLVLVRHREFIGDVPMTVGFSNKTYVITPTNRVLFPWLSTSAPSFQEYKIMGMIFEFRSLAANAVSGTNAGMGSITACLSYDIYQPDPTTKSEANNCLYAVSCKPSESMMIPVECAPAETGPGPLFIRHGVDVMDAHFYDFAKLHVITQGASAAYAGAGELWCTYEIALIKPCINPVPVPIGLSRFMFQQTVILNALFDTRFISQENHLNVTMNGSNFSFSHTSPAGRYYLTYQCAGATSSAVASMGPALAYSNGLTGLNYFYGNTQSYQSVPNTSIVTSIIGVEATFTYDGNATASFPPTVIQSTTPAAGPTTTNRSEFFLIYLGPVVLAATAPDEHPLDTQMDEIRYLRRELEKNRIRNYDDEEEYHERKRSSSPTPSNLPSVLVRYR